MATIIATLIMLAAATLFTSIVLYWGLAFQGQSLQNYGNAIFRSNNAAAEQVSIDTVLFTKFGSPTNAYTATIYVRNFGDNPIKIAGVHITNLQSGSIPIGYDCELTPHLTIVARFMSSIALTTNVTCSPALGIPFSTFSSSWNSATIQIKVSTEAGTSYQNNYAVPP